MQQFHYKISNFEIRGLPLMNNHHNHHLGVNRTGKNIRKSPIHQPNFQPHPPPQNRQQQQNQQPQVYNISKNDFRDVVQQLTGTPSREPSPNPPLPQPATRPPTANLPKGASLRLQKIRPPPLAPIAHRIIPTYNNPNAIAQNNSYHYNSNQNPTALLPRPLAPPPQQPPPSAFPPTPPSLWASVTESPVSVYMRYLENSVLNPELSLPAQLGRGPPQPPPHPHPGLTQFPPQIQRSQLGPPPPQPPYPGGSFNSPRGPASFPSMSPMGLLPSPTAFMNLLSPRSPYPPLLSPRFQFPSPLSPSFFLSPLSQPGMGLLGPGPQPPPSPGLLFPSSPSWFVPSPRWRDLP